ncbi:MAG TPA: hypothetical protein VK970_20165 [Candidatus Methylacidiphilales bacterium]|nr:hypothetical protein [Candidatus Methylacidiphilales bacterium]
MSQMVELRVMVMGDFAAAIPEGVLDGSGLVTLANGKRYSIYIENGGKRSCSVDIRCGGQGIGFFSLEAGQSAQVEKSTYDGSGFTFQRRDDGAAAGTVRVQFTPEGEPTGSAAVRTMEFRLTAPAKAEAEVMRGVRGEELRQEEEEEEEAPLAAGIGRRPFILGILMCSLVAGVITAISMGRSMSSSTVAFALGSAIAFVLVGPVPSLVSGGPLNIIPLTPALVLYVLRLRNSGSHWAWVFLTILPLISLFVTVPCMFRSTKGRLPSRD